MHQEHITGGTLLGQDVSTRSWLQSRRGVGEGAAESIELQKKAN
jgi:hypothetical protein